jgi:flagellar biosynthesis protein FlhA
VDCSTLKEEALMKGFTVVDAPTIISTHISEIIKNMQKILLQDKILLILLID